MITTDDSWTDQEQAELDEARRKVNELQTQKNIAHHGKIRKQVADTLRELADKVENDQMERFSNLNIENTLDGFRTITIREKLSCGG